MGSNNVAAVIRKGNFKHKVLSVILVSSFIVPGIAYVIFHYVLHTTIPFILQLIWTLLVGSAIFYFIKRAYQKGNTMVVAYLSFYLFGLLVSLF